MGRSREAGQALVFTAVAMFVLIGFAGLGVDMGMLRYQRRLQQSAADAAAIAGADNLTHPTNGGVIAAAQSASATDQFADTGGGEVSDCTAPNAAIGTVCVQVSDPASGPTTGPHTGDPKYVEVFVAKVHPTYFMKIMGITKEVVMARAVATNTSGGINNGCLYTLGPPSNSIEGVNINGSAILNATTCGIEDNGDFNTKGNKLIVNAGTFGVSGSANQSGPGGTVTCTVDSACPVYGVPAASDPYSTLTPPCSPCTGGSAISINGNGGFTGSGVSYSNGIYTVSPGTYSSISISGTGGGNTVVFSAGIYVITGSGGLTIPGNATISGTGVTFYFTNTATINMTGTPTMNLTAPTSGIYTNILMYQDPTDTNTTGPSLGGNVGSNYTGVLYFPSDQLTFYGNNTSINVGVVVADSLNLSGNPTVNLEGAKGLPGSSTLTIPTLVE